MIKILLSVLIAFVSMSAQLSMAKENKLLGVWKNTKDITLLQTIEFKADGTYLFCGYCGNYLVSRKLEPKLSLIHYKVKNENTLTLSGLIENNGPFNHNYKDHPVKYKLEDGVLSLEPLFLGASKYTRLNNAEFDLYLTSLKLSRKKIPFPDVALQKNISNNLLSKELEKNTLMAKRKGKLGEKFFLVNHRSRNPVRNLHVGKKTIRVTYEDKDDSMISKGDVITWVSSEKNILAYPDVYSLYGVHSYNNKLAIKDPKNKAKILEVIFSKNNKSQVVFKAEINNEVYILMVSKKSLGTLQFKKGDSITWAEGKVLGLGYAPIPNPDKLTEMFVYGVGK